MIELGISLILIAGGVVSMITYDRYALDQKRKRIYRGYRPPEIKELHYERKPSLGLLRRSMQKIRHRSRSQRRTP